MADTKSDSEGLLNAVSEPIRRAIKFATDEVSLTLDSIISARVDAGVFRDTLQQYNVRLYRWLNTVSTIVHGAVPQSLEELFVDVDVGHEHRGSDRFDAIPRILSNADGRRVMIVGYGGSGKTFLLRRLAMRKLLEDTERLNVFVNLRSFKSGNYLHQVPDRVSSWGLNLSSELLEKLMEMGRVTFFLDGFDEVGPQERHVLEAQIGHWSTVFPLCPVYMTTRPLYEFRRWGDFVPLHVRPLTWPQRLEMLRKTFGHLPLIDDFVKYVCDAKHKNHLSELAENPLFLLVMFRCYRRTRSLEPRPVDLFQQAFDVLWVEHDQISKDVDPTAFVRSRRVADATKASYETICIALALEMYNSRSSKVEISRHNLHLAISGIIAENRYGFGVESVIGDLMECMCVLVQDGDHYRFLHRCVQEFFIARSVLSTSRQTREEGLWDVLLRASDADRVFEYVCDLNINLVEDELYLPAMRRLNQAFAVVTSAGFESVHEDEAESLVSALFEPSVSARLLRRDGVLSVQFSLTPTLDLRVIDYIYFDVRLARLQRQSKFVPLENVSSLLVEDNKKMILPPVISLETAMKVDEFVKWIWSVIDLTAYKRSAAQALSQLEESALARNRRGSRSRYID